MATSTPMQRLAQLREMRLRVQGALSTDGAHMVRTFGVQTEVVERALQRKLVADEAPAQVVRSRVVRAPEFETYVARVDKVRRAAPVEKTLGVSDAERLARFYQRIAAKRASR